MASGETSASTPSPSIARSSVKRKASAELPTVIPAKRVEGIDNSPGISVDTVNREEASVDVLDPINIVRVFALENTVLCLRAISIGLLSPPRSHLEGLTVARAMGNCTIGFHWCPLFYHAV